MRVRLLPQKPARGAEGSERCPERMEAVLWPERLAVVKMPACFPEVEVGMRHHPSQNVDKVIVRFTRKCRGPRISQIGVKKEKYYKISLSGFLGSQKSFL